MQRNYTIIMAIVGCVAAVALSAAVILFRVPLKVTITEVPTEQRAYLTGRVDGPLKPALCVIVFVETRGNDWIVKPSYDDYITPIDARGSFSVRIIADASIRQYACLLVDESLLNEANFYDYAALKALASAGAIAIPTETRLIFARLLRHRFAFSNQRSSATPLYVGCAVT